MDKMHASGITVILDIAVRPAPFWLHHKHPSIPHPPATWGIIAR
ncbi:MAG: hypothetical protein WB699_06905 [Bacteroidota bacterium]